MLLEFFFLQFQSIKKLLYQILLFFEYRYLLNSDTIDFQFIKYRFLFNFIIK